VNNISSVVIGSSSCQYISSLNSNVYTFFSASIVYPSTKSGIISPFLSYLTNPEYTNLTKSLSTSLFANIGFTNLGVPINPSVYEPPYDGIIIELLSQDLVNNVVKETTNINIAISVFNFSFLSKNLGNCFNWSILGIFLLFNLSNSLLLGSVSL